jgi:hypothetical protein
VAPPGYVLLPEEPRVLWGEAAEREAALNRLMPLGPFESDAPWDELPQAFIAMDVDHRGLLGTSRWVQRGEPRGLNEYLLELVKPVGPGRCRGAGGGPAKTAAAHQDGWLGDGIVPLRGHRS